MSKNVTDNLQTHIQTLNKALNQTSRIDAATCDALKTLQDRIEQFLNEHDERTLRERLEKLAVKFENDHPTVGKALRQVVDALAKAGM